MTGVLLILITAVAIFAAGYSNTSKVLALTTAAVYEFAAWSITGPQQHRLLATLIAAAISVRADVHKSPVATRRTS